MTLVIQTGHNLVCYDLRPYTSFEYAQKGSLCTEVRCQCFSDHPSIRCVLAVCDTREREDKAKFLMGFYIRTNCENDCCITFVFLATLRCTVMFFKDDICSCRHGLYKYPISVLMFSASLLFVFHEHFRVSRFRFQGFVHSI